MSRRHELTANTLLTRIPGISAVALGDETVMLSLLTNNYYALDEVGSRIWSLLEQPQTFGALCTRLMKEYQVDAVTCQDDVAELLQQMMAEQLVIPCA